MHGVESYLILYLHFVRPGKIWFKFRVDAEPNADGLMFFQDGNRVPISQNYVEFIISTQLELRSLSFDVEAGWHTFKWVYIKDLTFEAGMDAAILTEVGYTGTDHGPLDCTPCPPGSTSRKGAARCSPCAADHVYDPSGSACDPCPDGTYALPGDVACYPRPNCTEADWQVLSGEVRGAGPGAPCEAWQQHVWTEPRVCAGGLPLPPNATGLPCALCPAGTWPAGAGGVDCQFCPEGYYRPELAAGGCEECRVGHEAVRARVYSSFLRWGDGLSRYPCFFVDIYIYI
jgi:hypothetical protein